MMSGEPTRQAQMSKDYSLFRGSDRLEPLRGIMRGGLNSKCLQTPQSERGSSMEMGEGASREQVEPKSVYNARQFREEGTRPPSAPDPWDVVASAYGFSMNQPEPSRSSWPIRRAPGVCWASMDSLTEALPDPMMSTGVPKSDRFCMWQPLPVPKVWTGDFTCLFHHVQRHYPATMAVYKFPYCLRSLYPDFPGSPALALNIFSHCPLGEGEARADSAWAAVWGPLVGPPPGQGTLPLLSPELQPLLPSPSQEVEPQAKVCCCCRRHLYHVHFCPWSSSSSSNHGCSRQLLFKS
ncbi:hypothetical protein STEG23_021588 [Scotinomys teguina]